MPVHLGKASASGAGDLSLRPAFFVGFSFLIINIIVDGLAVVACFFSIFTFLFVLLFLLSPFPPTASLA